MDILCFVIAAVLIVLCIIFMVLLLKKNKAPKKDAAVLNEKKEEPSEEAPAEEEPAEEVTEEEPAEEEPAEEVTEEEVLAEEVAEEEPAEEAADNTPGEEEPAEEEPAEKAVEETPAEETEAEEVFAEETTNNEEEVKDVKEEKKAASRSKGKWTIEIKSDKEYVAKLTANNGQVMLTSEIYASEKGARDGIDTILRNVASDNFEVYKDKRGSFYFKVKTAGNKILCVGEVYKSKSSCENAIESVKNIAPDAEVKEGVDEGERYIDYEKTKVELPKTPGKWTIEEEEGKFFACLYASNGQLMFSTENYASKSYASKAIETVKENASAGNFVIEKDKFGMFYYKLRNDSKSVLGIGETYKTKSACVSAIESVRGYALNSNLVS